MEILLEEMRVAKVAPASAPRVVATSRNIPTLMLEMPSFT
jgi:hypothetical protein